MKRNIKGLIFMIFMLIGICVQVSAAEGTIRKTKSGSSIMRVPQNPIVRIKLGKDYEADYLKVGFFKEGSAEPVDGYYSIDEDGICTVIPKELLKKGMGYEVRLEDKEQDVIALQRIFIIDKEIIKERAAEDIELEEMIDEYTFSQVQREKLTYRGWQYYIKYNSNEYEDFGCGSLWRIHEEKRADEYLGLDWVKRICYIDQEWCYVEKKSKEGDSKTFYMVKTDGSREIKLGGDNSRFIGVKKDYVYFIDIDKLKNGTLKRIEVGHENEQVLHEDISFKYTVDMNIKIRNDKDINRYIEEKYMTGMERRDKQKDVYLYFDEERENFMEREKEIPINGDEKLELLGNVIGEDDEFIYYYSGELYIYIKEFGSRLYQKEGHRIYRQNKETKISELVAQNVFFKLPEYVLFEPQEKEKKDMQEDENSIDLGVIKAEDMYDVMDKIQKSMLMNHMDKQKYNLTVEYGHIPQDRSIVEKYLNVMLMQMEDDISTVEKIARDSLKFQCEVLKNVNEIQIYYSWCEADGYFQEFDKIYHHDGGGYLKLKDIEDLRIRAAVRAKTRVKHGNFGEGLTRNELLDIKELKLYDFTGKDEVDLQGLKLLINLREFDAEGFTEKRMKNMEALGELGLLKVLKITHSEIEDIEFLRGSKRLVELDLSDNNIEDITILKEFKDLKILDLSDNRITDAKPLNELTSLRRLNLWGMDVKIKDIRDLLESLEEIHIQSK